MSHNEKELALYEDRLKARRDASTDKKVSFQEGLAQGENLGLGRG